MKKSVLFLTVRKTQGKEIEPVKQRLKLEGWIVKHVHFERVYEHVETFLSRIRRHSLVSLYQKPTVEDSSSLKKRVYHYVALFLHSLVRLFRLEMPSVLVVLTNSPPCRIASEVYARRKLPTVLFMHTGVAGENYEASQFQGFHSIAVVGNHVKDTLVNCGVSETKITVTGRPSNDLLLKERYDKTEICQDLGLDPSLRIVVYMTENVPEISIPILNALCKVVENLDCQLLVKVHPSENIDVYRNFNVARDIDVRRVLAVSDVVVSSGLSSTVLDAMVLKKPTVCVNFSGFKEPFPYVESGASLGVFNAEELEDALQEAFLNRKNECRERFVLDHAFNRDGLATERTVELLEHVFEECEYGNLLAALEESWESRVIEESRLRNWAGMLKGRFRK